jgi:DNA polymerase-1
MELPVLPLLRGYFLPDPGALWVHRDYSQQELRILAHFEDGVLAEAYRANPHLDVHDYVRSEIKQLRGIDLDRQQTKILNFGLVYGMGMGKLAEGLGCSVDEARKVKDAQRAAIPGLGRLEMEIRQRGKTGNAIYTWGDRAYYAEEPKMIDGEMRTYEYKLLNYLIQGSAADCTKQALINYEHTREHGRLLCTVHDEINISVPHKHVQSEMKILHEAMLSVQFDVPMLSEGKTGSTWGMLKEYTDAN